jgi:hypothetical protein
MYIKRLYTPTDISNRAPLPLLSRAPLGRCVLCVILVSPISNQQYLCTFPPISHPFLAIAVFVCYLVASSLADPSRFEDQDLIFGSHRVPAVPRTIGRRIRPSCAHRLRPQHKPGFGFGSSLRLTLGDLETRPPGRL